MNNKYDSILGLIGLATKARKTVTGSDTCEKAIKADKAALVILAEDTSEKTKIPVRKLCEYHQTPFREFAVKEDLGRFSGKAVRAMIVITDPGFAGRLTELIDAYHQNTADTQS